MKNQSTDLKLSHQKNPLLWLWPWELPNFIRALLVDPFAGLLRSKHEHIPPFLPNAYIFPACQQSLLGHLFKEKGNQLIKWISWAVYEMLRPWSMLISIYCSWKLLLDTNSGLFQAFPGGCCWEQGEDVHPGLSLGATNIRREPPHCRHPLLPHLCGAAHQGTVGQG